LEALAIIAQYVELRKATADTVDKRSVQRRGGLGKPIMDPQPILASRDQTGTP